MRVGRPQLTSRKALHTRAAPSACWLVIMARLPVMGRVKTRLAREVGAVEATRFYRHTLRTVVCRLGRDPRWRTVLAVSPDAAIGARGWPAGAARMPQGRGDLGRRMQRLVEAPPPGRVLVVGTDIPGIRPAHIAGAFRLLGSHDAVLAPAGDGGYWLVGLRRVPPTTCPFTGVRWSSPHALADTCANLAAAGARVGMAALLHDVDTSADLRRMGPASGRVVPSRG